MAADGGQRLFAQVVSAVGYQYEQPFGCSVSIVLVSLLNSRKQALRVARLDHDDVAVSLGCLAQCK